MTENVNLEPTAEPQAGEKRETAEPEETIPSSDEKEILIPVKFNKETRNLKLEEASILAQKGMKFELISKEYEGFKQLAREEGQSVSEFLCTLSQRRNNDKKNELLEKCCGNEELAEHIIELEKLAKKSDADELGFSELKAQFPEIESVSALPEEVVETARLKGTLLLDEYLRYKLLCKKQAEAALAQQHNAEKSSIGSQFDRRNGLNPEATEFLKGLWK